MIWMPTEKMISIGMIMFLTRLMMGMLDVIVFDAPDDESDTKNEQEISLRLGYFFAFGTHFLHFLSF